jgi:YfiH family protein
MNCVEPVISLNGSIRWLSYPPLQAFPFVLHGFLAKASDSSGVREAGAVEETLCKITSQKKRLITLTQIHQDQCVVITQKDSPEANYRGDAILTNRNDLFVSVQVADCLPLFLVNETSRVVGLVHAGWRGTILGVVRNTLKTAKSRLGCKAGDFTAMLGPCIRSCCYRVSDDVAVLFDRDCIERTSGDSASLDLVRANVKQLTDCGVEQNRIYLTEDCTCCNVDLFFSHRRESDNTGRMTAFMALR